MIQFLKGIKRAADWFNVNPEGISFKDEQRVKALESTVKFFSKEFIESSGNRYDLKFIKLEEAIFELKKSIHYLGSELYSLKSSKQLALPVEQVKTTKKPKAVKLKPVEEQVKKVKSTLTQAKVKRLFEYRDGELYWNVDRSPKVRKGKIAGSILRVTKNNSYRIIGYKRKSYRAAQLIFLMFHGYLPENVSYKDKNTLNTKIENLIAANNSQLRCKAKKPSNNKTGYKGVSVDKHTNQYKAQINKLGKHYILGYFNTAEEAHKAYCKAAKKLHGEFAQVA